MKLEDWHLFFFPGVKLIYEIGQNYKAVYMFSCVDYVDKILFYVEKIWRNLHIYNVSHKNKKFNEQWKAKYKTKKG